MYRLEQKKTRRVAPYETGPTEGDAKFASMASTADGFLQRGTGRGLYPSASPMSPAASTHDVRLRDRAIARTLPMMPRRLVRRFSAPYIAGESLKEAMGVVRRLRAGGMTTTMDVLGEAISSRRQAQATHDAYLETLDELATVGDAAVMNVSVKLTALGLSIEPVVALDFTRSIVERARELGGFVRIDMEDSPYTDDTLDVFRTLRREGFENVGIVIQAYLLRSAEDVAQLAAEGARVRLVKGIYLEPAAIAFHDMERINRSFLELAEVLLAAGCHTAFATHDERLVRGTQALVARLGIGREQYEYQMLLGVQEQLRDEVLAAGHPLRVYVPFGHQWYEYSLRRLRENPRVAGHVADDVLGSMKRRLRLGRRTRGGVGTRA
jgi:proline dehydrogenase